MARTRKKYSEEYKREAVALVNSSGKSASQIARDLGIEPNMLTRWCRKLEAAGPKKSFQGQGKPRDEELAALCNSWLRSSLREKSRTVRCIGAIRKAGEGSPCHAVQTIAIGKCGLRCGEGSFVIGGFERRAHNQTFNWTIYSGAFASQILRPSVNHGARKRAPFCQLTWRYASRRKNEQR